ncbi:hypothetical protein BLNAU_24974 [Blattamonas nauphoetae]|uniref:Uncharacterized protein n=1 Tax=Blattamonas nauphoetae TaxID=2049346 RepID=A0ABQ9WKX8_9EUKA|nr:hypothetical protein BLNAU_24974 [Blattamonas nauphoetae]
MKTLSEADYVERKDLYASPRISLFRLADDQDLKNLSKRPSANSKNKVVLGGHSACGIVTHRFVTSGIVDQSWIDAYIFVVISSGAPSAVLRWRLVLQRRQESGCSVVRGVHNQHSDARLRLSALDDPQQEHLRRQLCRWPAQSDIMRNITMKNRTWTFDQGGKAGLKTDIQHTRNITDKPLVKPKVMTHVMYSIGVTTTAGVILNATNPRRWSDTHSDYYVDGDGTVPIVSLSVLRKWRDTSLVEFHTYRGCDHMGIITDAVPIGHILDITAPETAANMEDEDSLNPPDDFLAVYVNSPHFYPVIFAILYLQRVPLFAQHWTDVIQIAFWLCSEYFHSIVISSLDCGRSGDDLPGQNKQSFIERNPSSYQASNPLFNHHSSMKLILSLSSSTGRINLKTPSTRRVTELPLNYSHLKEGACVWM